MNAIAKPIVDQWADPRWRINNLYYIVDKAGRKVPFRLNWAQERFLDNMHYLNIVLKARQLGFSTFIQLFMLDACVFNSNTKAGTIAHTREDAQAIFRDRAKFPYDNLPEAIRQINPAIQDSARELSFANNSSIRVGTSLRSGTFQYLHISEHGKICAKYPEKAREVRTGALNTVQAGQFIFDESTAEGQSGDFHAMCQTAETLQRRGVPLTPLDFKFHFFPWWEEPNYAIAPDGVEIPAEMVRYFKELETDHGIKLRDDQKAWYVKKYETQQEDMGREYPSTSEEAFRSSVEGSIFGKWIFQAEKQGRIAKVPHDPALKVNTWWDLGRSDAMAIWFWQKAGPEYHFIDYLEHSGEDLDWYAAELQKRQQDGRWSYGRHSWPHDGGHIRLGYGNRPLSAMMHDLGFTVEVQPQYDIRPTITRARQILPLCYFDAEKCSEGLKALRNYRYEWNDEHSCWKKDPLHDGASHGASAFRCGATAHGDSTMGPKPSRSRYSGSSAKPSAWAA